MTEISLFRRDGKTVGFEAEGHSGYAEEGSDIVCSAISALTQTAVLGLTEALGLCIASEMNEARLYCMLPAGLESGIEEKAELILETMSLGLYSIEQTYGRYLRITEREV